MTAQASIYLPYAPIDLAEVVAGARFEPDPDGGRFVATVGSDVVAFSVMASQAVAAHLAGMRTWLARCDGSVERRRDAWRALSETKTVLGLVAGCEFAANHRLWQCLFEIADRFDGYVFVNSSVLLPSGAILCGAMLVD
jgi:hypothetical protein